MTDLKVVEKLMDQGKSYSEIAAALSFGKPKVAALCQQVKMFRGEIMGDIDPEYVRKRYLDDACEIEELIAEMGYSKAYWSRFIVVWGLSRDRGHLHRAGTKRVWNCGKKDPKAKRNRPRATYGSAEHRAKQAAAKRGRFGELANNWKGGVPVYNGYLVRNDGGKKIYIHRIVAEEYLGRTLTDDEAVHHMDFDKINNDPGNLLVLSNGDHSRLHSAIRHRGVEDQIAWLEENGIKFEVLING